MSFHSCQTLTLHTHICILSKFNEWKQYIQREKELFTHLWPTLFVHVVLYSTERQDLYVLTPSNGYPSFG